MSLAKLKSYFKTPVIEFLCEEEYFGVIPEPVSAKKLIPQWFKDVPTKINSKDDFGAPARTAKHCIPMIDAMSMGFIIPLAGDVNIRAGFKAKAFEVKRNPALGDLITFHTPDQVGGNSGPTKGMDAIKFVNRWMIKTAPGWSVLIIPCINSLETRFTCLSAVVDTDVYDNYIHFPAIWNNPDSEEHLLAGTPLVTVIPFKRSITPTEARSRAMTKKESAKRKKVEMIQNSRKSYYTKEKRKPR